MFQQFIGFFRRLFRSKGFRIGTRIFLCVFGAYLIYNTILFLIAVMNTGASLGDALKFFFRLPLADGGRLHATSTGRFIGIAIGLIWFFTRRSKKNDSEDAEESQKAENKPDEKPEAQQEEEEIIESKHYTFH